MKQRKLYLAALALTFMLWSQSNAQDFHFSQFYASPLTLNPAHTGITKKDYRFAVNYRSQWTSLGTTASKISYSTFAASFDLALFNGFRKGDAINGGILLMNDKAGDGILNTSLAALSVSYNLALGPGNAPHLIAGAQGGFGNRSLNTASLQFGSQINPVTRQFDANILSGENTFVDNHIYPDLAAGILWYYQPHERLRYYAGSSLFHINRPGRSFASVIEEQDRLSGKWIIHGGAQVSLQTDLDLQPAFLWARQNNSNEVSIGSLLKYTLHSKYTNDKSAVSGGLWYRFQDALILALQLEFKDYTLGISYDVNVSSLAKASHLRGGPEFSLIYNGNFPYKWKRNKEKVKTLCPVF